MHYIRNRRREKGTGFKVHTMVSVIVPVATFEQASEIRDACQPVIDAGVGTTVRFSRGGI